MARRSYQDLLDVSKNLDTMGGKVFYYAQNIQQIVALIRSISFQTSLLSLNTAIGAARADPAGITVGAPGSFPPQPRDWSGDLCA